jgi:hypothetical protein
MPSCFTCGKDITFDKTIVSKTGKQIPLWPDKESAHGHDQDGNAIRQPLPIPTNPYQGQQPAATQQQSNNRQFNTTQGFSPNPQATNQGGYYTTTKPQEQQSSSGGSYMDTKRLRVMTEELQRQANLIDEKLEACYQLDKSNNAMLGELIQLFKINDPKSAKDLYDAMQHTKQDALKPEPEIRGWNSDTQQQDDFPVEQTLKDEDDDDEGGKL